MMGGRQSTSHERREVLCTVEGGIVEKSLARLVGSEGRLCTLHSLFVRAWGEFRYQVFPSYHWLVGYLFVVFIHHDSANSGGTLLQSPPSLL